VRALEKLSTMYLGGGSRGGGGTVGSLFNMPEKKTGRLTSD